MWDKNVNVKKLKQVINTLHASGFITDTALSIILKRIDELPDATTLEVKGKPGHLRVYIDPDDMCAGVLFETENANLADIFTCKIAGPDAAIIFPHIGEQMADTDLVCHTYEDVETEDSSNAYVLNTDRLIELMI